MPAERRCTGPCGRTLPEDAEHFYPRSDGGGGGLMRRCRECVKAAQRKREAAQRKPPALKRCVGRCGRELPANAKHFHRQRGGDGFKARCRACTNADERARRAVDTAAKNARPTPCGFASDRGARFRLIQRRAEMNPRDHAAAGRARRIAAAADRAVEDACRPPFDGWEVLLELAEAAETGDTRSVGAGRALANVLRDRRP
jgi:hypothetical protein